MPRTRVSEKSYYRWRPEYDSPALTPLKKDGDGVDMVFGDVIIQSGVSCYSRHNEGGPHTNDHYEFHTT